ncbi:hypothetical protein C8R45DRAFT_1209605 [Mycena sanguinolenta]|nr:hypothetical protein C8R45DRAFT_1209605 [Mycena sanguinolenta]
MTSAPFSMRALILEQRERTRNSSKADIERFIQESELKITSQISAFVALRDLERICVAALRDYIAPIHTLPAELLAEIFDLAIQPDRWHVESVFGISQVCWDWRQVAHSTPQLWTRPLQIDLRFATGSDGEVYAGGLKTWLLRSAPLAVPVSLMVHYHNVDHRILEEVLSTAPRWRSLSLDLPGFTPVASPFVRQLAEGRFDNLEELDLGQLMINENDSTAISFAVPRLRKMHLNLASNAHPVLVPWARLTDLTLQTRYHNIASDILAQCTSLVHADVRTIGRGLLSEVAQITPLSHLLSLSCVGKLYLNFGATEIDAPWTQARFTAFQLRTPNITHLDLKYSRRLTSDDLRTAIRHAPSLTHLELTSCDSCIDDVLLDALCYKAGTSPLAPHLHTLLLNDPGDNFTEVKMARMIASRWWTDGKLIPPAVARWTRVQLCGDFSPYFVDWDILKDLPSDVLTILCRF